MTDLSSIESLVLEHLCTICSKLNDHDERFGRVELRLSSLELTVAGMRRDLAHRYDDTIVEQPVRNDQLNARIERLER